MRVRSPRRLLALLLLGGCAAAHVSTPSESPAHDPEPVSVTVEALRKEQLERLYRFDGDLGVMGDRCQALCSHHTSICGLATRICGIAKANANVPRAADLCEVASATCKDTSARLPTDCFCQ